MSDHVGVNGYLQIMWMEVVVPYFKVLFQHSSGGRERERERERRGKEK
jgi:hypothetical protein